MAQKDSRAKRTLGKRRINAEKIVQDYYSNGRSGSPVIEQWAAGIAAGAEHFLKVTKFFTKKKRK
ncbi:hypothetical protein H6771_02145 [Candidatus Peribacteria bacterium]|nr:hypothetical protein [Candidatus Peribacteria bacterium]